MKRLALLAGLMMVGCGGAGGGGGGESVAVPPVVIPVTLQSLAITPATLDLELADTASLTATATYSDASQQTVSCAWSKTGTPVSLGALLGTSIDITATDTGSATVHATFQTLTAHAIVNVTDPIPADPGPVYAIDQDFQILEYPSDGGAPAVIDVDWNAGSYNVLVNGDGTYLYSTTSGGLRRMSLTSPAGFTVLPNTTPFALATGLDFDTQGRIYTQDITSGTVYRYDPATGTTATLGNNGGNMTSFQVGPDGALYYTSFTILSGQSGLYRHDPATDVVTQWSTVNNGWIVSMGIAMNREGEAFTGDFFQNSTVWRCRDVNGDGDALDLGENSTFAVLPPAPDDMYYGITLSGGGSILVNNLLGSGGQALGIYWVRDLDGDGTTVGDAGEATLYNSNYVYNGSFGSFMAAPR